MDKVFISYRRDDSGGYARAMYQHLVMRFGPNAVFMDLETLQPGLDFVSQLRDILKSAKVVLVLIGKDWAGPRENGTARINDPHDFVRLEVALALEIGVPVVPVILGTAAMPPEVDLPEDVRGLLRRHAMNVTHPRFVADMEPLVSLVANELGVATGWGRVRRAVASQWNSPMGVYRMLCGINALLLVALLLDDWLNHSRLTITAVRAVFGSLLSDNFMATALSLGRVQDLLVGATGTAFVVAIVIAAFRRFSQRGLANGLLIAGLLQVLFLCATVVPSLVTLWGPDYMRSRVAEYAQNERLIAIVEVWACSVFGLMPLALVLASRHVRRLPAIIVQP